MRTKFIKVTAHKKLYFFNGIASPLMIIGGNSYLLS